MLNEDFCALQNVTYDHRVYNPDDHNWCPVPGGGADALLYGGLAVLIGCLLYSRLSAVWVLLAGAGLQLLSFSLNLGHLSNAITLWLGMRPSTMFFQIFLPPLLLDSAVRVDFFLFKKMVVHVLLFASVNVIVSTLAAIPFMLYGLNLAAAGWRPIDAALFGAMLGSTDAVAVTAILKAGGAPEMLSVLLEGESLFNDASSIVLFEIFLHLSMSEGDVSLMGSAWEILGLIGWLASTGAAAGLLMGMLTRVFIKLLSRRHVPPAVEVAVSLAGAYIVYLGTEYYIHGSGVIAVVVYGLYGSATFLYGISSKGMRQDAFFKFWDVMSFTVNGMVFFFVGTSVMHFMLSLAGELFQGGTKAALLLSLQALPIIAAMFALRWLLMTLEGPLLSLVGPSLSWQEVLFSTMGGLRGGLALILAQTVIANHGVTKDPQLKVIHAEMAIWTAAVVLFTLTVNAPLLGPLMTMLGLNKITPAQQHMHRRAYAALAAFTKRTVEELQVDDDEMLKGVDWTAVVAGADLCLGKAAKKVFRSNEPGEQPSKPPLLDLEPPPTDQLLQTHQQQRMRQPSSLPSSVLNFEQYNTQRTSTDRASVGSPAVGFRGQGLESPKPRVLSRASLARSSMSVMGLKSLTAPLLSRQRSMPMLRGAADQYSYLDDDDLAAQEGDVEAPAQKDVPQVVAESSSEAVFIASRLIAQDEQLAKHAAEAADCPFLARTITGGSSDAITEAAAAAAAEDVNKGGSFAQYEQQQEEGDENDATCSETSLSRTESAGTPEGQQADADLASSTPSAVPKFKLLSPVVVLRMTDALKNSHALQHTQAPGMNGAPAASAAKPDFIVAAGGASELRRGSFMSSSVIGSNIGYGYGNSGRASMLSRGVAAGSSGGSFIGGSGGSGVGSRRSSYKLLNAVWQERSAPPEPCAANADASTSSSLSSSWPSGLQEQQQQEQQGQVHSANGIVAPAPPAASGPAASGYTTRFVARDFEQMSEFSDDEEGMTQEYLEECRVTLLAGLKRHFRFKAAEGLLSKTGLRMLDYACDACLIKPGQPLSMWSTVKRDFKRRGLSTYTAALLFRLRCYQTTLLRSQTGGGSSFLWRWLLQGPISRTSMVLRNRLGNVSLTVLEVALELWLALTASPQARMTRQSRSNTSGILQEELKQQADAVWRFIMDRQIEAPDEFASLQTHRLQLAVARRQLAFVEHLAEVGALEESAAEALQELVEHRLHKLEARGPSWRSPSLTDVLRRQPFLAGEDESMLLWLRAYGELKSYSPGQCMVPRRRSGPPGIFIVLSGLVRVEVVRAGEHKTQYVGVGGSVGFISSLLGRELPGVGLVAAFAQGNVLGRGPLVLHLPMRLLATIRQRAAPAIQQQHTQNETPTAAYMDVDAAPQSLNAAAFAQLLLDMHRQAGIMLLDRMGSSVGQRLAAHVEGAVQAIFEYVSQLPPSEASPKLQRLLEALLGSTAGSGIAAADIAAEPNYYISSNPAPPAAAGNMAGQGATFLSDSEAAMQLVAERAAAAAALLRELLRTADLVTLTAGQQISQTSTMMLLNGSLRLLASSSSSRRHAHHSISGIGTAGSVAAGAAAAGAVGVGGAGGSITLHQYNAPTLIAWAPELFENIEDRYTQQPPLYTAGPRGALLLITPSTWQGSSGVSPGEQLQEQQGLAPAGTADLAGVGSSTGQQQRRKLERLSSVMPLQIATPVLGQDHDDV